MAIDPASHFAPDYFSARDRFFAAAEARGAVLASHEISTRSPGGRALSIDTAYVGPESPESVIATSSGIHGVEGFAGSAIQHWLLSEWQGAAALPSSCGLLCVHALNPFGFAAIRRVNESNVDLNRNFVDHPDGHVANPGYDELFDAINPKSLDEAADQLQRGRLLEYAQQHGFPKLQEALTAGQYAHPEGCQFGGQRAEESNRLLREIAGNETRGARRVAWIDLHTGLGPFGEVEMIMESGPGDDEFSRAIRYWGGAVKSTQTGESVSAALHGPIEYGLRAALADTELTPVAAEFGTYDPARVFAAMRADNWLHQYGELDSDQGRAIKAEILEVFRPEAPAWGARVLEVAADVMATTRRGFVSD